MNTCHRTQELLLFKIERRNHLHAKYRLGFFSCIFMCDTNTSQVLKSWFFPLLSSYFFFLGLYILNVPCNAGTAAKCFPGKNNRVIKVWKKFGEQTRWQNMWVKAKYMSETRYKLCETEKLKLLWGEKKASFQLSLLTGDFSTSNNVAFQQETLPL